MKPRDAHNKEQHRPPWSLHSEVLSDLPGVFSGLCSAGESPTVIKLL